MSNLLDKASIILTPTAYNNGEALCIKPDDGSGDFDFSRNSAATRVNAQGLVENVQILSSNLVQNGDFSEEGVQEVSNGSFSQEGAEQITNGDFSNGSTDWILDSGWSVSDNKALCDGTNLAYITQTAVLTTGKSYKVQFDIVDYTSGSVKYRDNGFVSGQSFSGVGSYTDYVVAGGGQFRLMSENFIGSIDNVSVREVGQDWNLIGTATITENQANIVTASAVTGISQSNILTIGKSYKLSYNIVSNNNGGLKISGNEIPSVVGNNIYYFEASAAALEILRNSGITDISITNISVKEVGQNWTLGTGWSIGNGVAISDGVSADSNLNTNNIGYSVGDLLKVSFSVSNVTGGTLQIGLGATQTYSGITDGDYEFITTATRPDGKVFFKSVLFNGSITNISVIEITEDTNLPRINYEGFSYQDALGSELVTNGDFATDSDWSKGSGWSISGALNAAATTSTAFQINTGIVSGKTYNVTYTISNYVSGSVRIELGSGNVSVGTIRSANGTYTEYIVALGDETIYFDGIVSFTGSIDNVSVKEYLGQEVVPDSGCGSWLFEPQSTNLVPYSEDFSQWTPVGTPTITSNYGISPDGTQNSTRVQFDADERIASIFSSSGDITFSVYLKGSGVLTLRDNTNVYRQDVTLTSEWARYDLSFNATITSVQIQNQTASVVDCEVWGAQAENLTYSTSLIPTSGSTVTRNQDVCTNGGSLASINSTEGVLYAEIARSEEENLYRLLGIDDGTSNNYVKMGFENSRGAFWIRAVINGVTSISSDNALTSNPNEFYKIAIRYQSGNSAIYINGTSVLTTTTTFSSGNFTALDFNHWNNSLNFFGKTKALAVWKEALSDAELTELTTI